MSAIETEDRPVTGTEDSGQDPEFLRLKREVNAGQQARSQWRTDARSWYDMVANHQWADEDEKLLRDQNRPTVSFNRTAPLVKAVCGLEVNNRQTVVYLPRQIGVQGVNEMVTNAGKWVRDECNAEDEESEAFRDLAICGEGWTETRMDFDEDPQGKIVKERIDPLEMGVNKGASRANYVDARMVYRIREMDPDDVRALLNLPGREELMDAALDAKWVTTGATPADGGAGNKKDYSSKTRPGVTESAGRKKTVTIVQCQYWVREPVHLVATANDEQPKQMSVAEFETFKQRADANNAMAATNPEIQHIEYNDVQSVRRVYYECFIGMGILDRRPLKMGMFQFSAMTGDRDRKEKYFYGMVKDIMDPQRWSNKFLSQIMHHINVNAKGGLLAETDSFVNVKKAERDWADPTKIVWVKPGSLAKNKVKERTAIALPPGLDQLMTFAISSIRDVTGINLELLGQADREQAAILEQQRRQSAMTILATMFDSLRKYRKRDGKLLLHFVWLLPDNTLVRVVEQGQIKYIPLVKKGLELEKFDIIIDQAPSSPDQKQYIWSITAQILQMNILPPQAVIELLKYSPYPESVVQEIRKALGMDGQMPPEMLQQKLQQAEQALQFLEGKLKEAMEEADSKEGEETAELLRIQIDEYKAETDRLKAQWDARIKLAGEIATGEGGGSAGPNQVVSGSEQLPDISGGEGNEQPGTAVPSNLEQKVDQLAQMMQQLVSAMGGQQQQTEPVPAPSEIPPEQQA